MKVIQDKGYDFVETKDALLNSKSNKIWGSFSHHALAFDMDRIATNPEQPTLSQMTEKAIQTLSKDKDGFFLFIEGSKPDWAAHANDPIGMISDILAFDEAVAKGVTICEERWGYDAHRSGIISIGIGIRQKDTILHRFLHTLIH